MNRYVLVGGILHGKYFQTDSEIETYVDISAEYGTRRYDKYSRWWSRESGMVTLMTLHAFPEGNEIVDALEIAGLR